MEELIKALKLRLKYNRMTFDQFVDEYEKYSGTVVSKKARDEYKFTGLNNVDWLLLYEDTIFNY